MSDNEFQMTNKRKKHISLQKKYSNNKKTIQTNEKELIYLGGNDDVIHDSIRQTCTKT